MLNLVVQIVCSLWVKSVHKLKKMGGLFFVGISDGFIQALPTIKQSVLPNPNSQFNRVLLKFPTLSTIPINTITKLNTYY